MKKNLIRIVLVAAVGLLAFIFSYLGLGGLGGGGDKGQGGAVPGPAAPPVAPTQPATPPATSPADPIKPTTRPLTIVVEEHQYLVQGQRVSLEQIAAALEAIPAGPGPAVSVIRQPSSRAKAEVDLLRLLQDRKIPTAVSPPQ